MSTANLDHIVFSALSQHSREWSDDEYDFDESAVVLRSSSSVSSPSPDRDAAQTEGKAGEQFYLLSKQALASVAAATAAASSAGNHQRPPQKETAVPVRFICHLVPLPLTSASPEFLHRQSHSLRSTLRVLRSASRIANRALDELRQSIVHVSDDDDDADAHDDDGSSNPTTLSNSSSSRFNAEMWKSAVRMGGVVPPVSWLRTSCVVPAVANSEPPPIDLPVHCLLDVKCSVDARTAAEDSTTSGASDVATHSSSSECLIMAQLTALLCCVVSRMSCSRSLMRQIVRACFAGKVWCRNKSSSSSSSKSNSLLFVRPCLQDFVGSDEFGGDDQNEADSIQVGDAASLFDFSLDLILHQSSSININKDSGAAVCVTRPSLIDFVSSAFISLFSRSRRHNSTHGALLDKEPAVGAFGVVFRVAESRVALRAFTLPIERELVAVSTSNNVHLDLLETYVAAHLVKRSSQCTRETTTSATKTNVSSDGSTSAPFAFLAKATAFQTFQDSLLAATTTAAAVGDKICRVQSRLLTVDMLVLASVVGKGGRKSLVPCAEKVIATENNSTGGANTEGVYKTLLSCLSAIDNNDNNGEDSSCNSGMISIAYRLKLEMDFGQRLIPTSLRLRTWAALLGIFRSSPSLHSSSKKSEAEAAFRACSCDRQVSLDLPRCHPSDPFTRSPVGQQTIHRVVRMWLFVSRKRQEEQQHRQHPPLSTASSNHIHYWQGVDSMAAAVLSAGKDEHLAAHCLTRLIELFVPGFASSDAIRARVGRISGLLRFHDPFAAAHLDEACGVQIDHFALPWILTAFAHVFPLALTCRLWDALLLHAEPVSLLCNFTVAVIMASRLQFLNAPDLSSSLLVLRHAAASVSGSSASSSSSASPYSSPASSLTAETIEDENGSGQRSATSAAEASLLPAAAGKTATSVSTTALFETVLDHARKMTAAAPPFCPSWDDPAEENFIEEVMSSRRMLWSARGAASTSDSGNPSGENHGDDEEKGEEEDFRHNDEMRLKRFVPSLKLSDISVRPDGSMPRRWSRVFLVIAATDDAQPSSSSPSSSSSAAASIRSSLEQEHLLFVIATQRFHLNINVSSEDEEQDVESTVSKIRSLTRKSAAENATFVVAVVSAKKRAALETAVLLAAEGVKHVATVDLK